MIGAMRKISFQKFKEFVGTRDGKTFQTLRQRKPFVVQFTNNQISYIPKTTSKLRLHEDIYLSRIIDQFNRTNSFHPKDYVDITRNASYTLALINQYIMGENDKIKTWRMSFRCGDRGFKMWPRCFELGVAAITYRPLARADLSKYPQGEPKNLWAKLQPSQSASLKRVAYEMKKGDVIYVKEGPMIVSRGVVIGPYKFDSSFRLSCPDSDVPWSHQVPVVWESDFQAVRLSLGSEPTTVLPIEGERLQLIERTIYGTQKEIDQREAVEGERYRAEVIFRKRNRALIEAKKAKSNGLCEVCKFSFKESYGLAQDCLVAHHINPISGRVRASKTTLDDIALLCPNCHTVIHSFDETLSIEKLRQLLKSNVQKNRGDRE
jgi:5-methylcytosine-specific restriction endonuclease McrA